MKHQQKTMLTHIHKHIKQHGSHYFEYIVLGAKCLMILVLCIFAIINKYTPYVIEHPDYFIQDALCLGLSTALGAMFVSYVRTGNVSYQGAFIAFLFFFMYSVLREMSGYFAFLSNSNLTRQQHKQRDNNFIKFPVLAVILIVCMLCVMLAIIVRNVPNESTYKHMPSIHVWGQFALETVVFTLITASAEIYIDYRHNNEHGKIDKTEFTKSVLVTLLLFVIAHVLFQLGGLYDLFFRSEICTLSVTNSHVDGKYRQLQSHSSSRSNKSLNSQYVSKRY